MDEWMNEPTSKQKNQRINMQDTFHTLDKTWWLTVEYGTQTVYLLPKTSFRWWWVKGKTGQWTGPILSVQVSDLSLGTILAQSLAAGVGLSIIVASEPSTHSYGRKPLPVHGDGLAPLWSSISIRFAVRMEDMEKAKDIPTSLPTHAPKEQINLKEPVLFITPY